jgi:hypothetical protein
MDKAFKRIVEKVLCMYIRTYFLFRNGRLSTNSIFKLYKALIRSVITYACPIWEYVVDANILKSQCLQNRVLHAAGNFDRCTAVCELHMPFKILYVYDNITKVCRAQAEVIQNHVNPNVHGTGQEETMLGSIRGLNLTAVKPTTVQLTSLSFRVVK